MSSVAHVIYLTHLYVIHYHELSLYYLPYRIVYERTGSSSGGEVRQNHYVRHEYERVKYPPLLREAAYALLKVLSLKFKNA